ncbi:type IV conjugative transfer system pilin TraA [Acerihabitans sp. TG2]|uniref:type IV conjugative transfer system pilin TraA n=1 Tax=Acerihabitans sp. TG2 TaxID=3096008 RepID=UPI002B226EAE|nr:type IV conjugative transfer system pilin TraA [Acerihabitans sp. TG2]MEA9392684.1 type IV conjugative transfer system pilin TraA [Acerihabitans sp. TG2]
MKAVLTDSVLTEEGAVALAKEKIKFSGGLIDRIKFIFNSFSVTRFKLILQHSPTAQYNLIAFALAMLVIFFPHIAHATDLLAAQKTDANDTFGHGSTLEWTLYVAETIVSVTGYIKTRNPMVFVGLIIIILVTRTFFTLASGQ